MIKRKGSLMDKMPYVLITPARNEEKYIEKTIKSVIKQTYKPKGWIIVSDGSTDKTDEIVKNYHKKYNWIKLLRISRHKDRTFSGKAYCFNAGVKELKKIKYDILGNLDADISFDEEYFEYLIGRFTNNRRLGVAGTPFVERGKQYNYNYTNIEHVSGACQIFRKKCFDDVGGYIPIKGGGIDWVAVTTARMKGWETRTFTDKYCVHHKPMGSATNNKLMAWYKQGVKDYYLGGSLIWEMFRASYQMKARPAIVGGALLFTGYVISAIKRVDRPVEEKLMNFHRKEQMTRLKKIIRNNLAMKL
jgi:biofilm PGA synthesis N-glycosyltransferase PgaC